jgi:hypothetical protein
VRAAELPRYVLHVGQELVYAGSSKFEYTSGAHLSESKITLWVLSANPDGSWQIAGQGENAFTQQFASPARDGHPPGAGSAPPEKDEVFGTFDLFPDGRVAHRPLDRRATLLTGPFCPLPATAVEARDGWTHAEEGEDTELYRLRPEAAPGGPRVIERTTQGLFREVYGSERTERLTFDPKRGLVVKVESETRQSYGFQGKGTGLFELKESTEKAAEWMAQLRADVEVHRSSTEAYRTAVEASKTPVGERLAAGEKALRAGRAAAALPLVQAVFDRELALLANMEPTPRMMKPNAPSSSISRRRTGKRPIWKGIRMRCRITAGKS